MKFIPKKVLLYTSKCTRNKDLHQFSSDSSMVLKTQKSPGHILARTWMR